MCVPDSSVVSPGNQENPVLEVVIRVRRDAWYAFRGVPWLSEVTLAPQSSHVKVTPHHTAT